MRSAIAQLLAGKAQALGGKTVHMARWSAGFGGFPTRLKQFVIGQAHKNWVQRARPQIGIPADVITVSPLSRSLKKGIEYLNGLWRQPQAWTHTVDATYVEKLLSIYIFREFG